MGHHAKHIATTAATANADTNANARSKFMRASGHCLRRAMFPSTG
jgi:hypothetical protein